LVEGCAIHEAREARESGIIQKVERSLQPNFEYTLRIVDHHHPRRPTDFARGENQSIEMRILMIGHKNISLDDQRCMITFEQFTRLFGFGQNIANRHKIHYALHFDASKMRFMFPRNKRRSVRTTADLLPFYAYLTLFGRRSKKSRRALSRVMVMYPKLCI
jgi:hypothetical protein